MGKAKAVVEDKEPLEVESVANEDEDDDDEEMGEDEYVSISIVVINKLISYGRYVVEKILNHLVDDEDGTLKYEVKWAGYEKKSDRTWEPEENLSVSRLFLTLYS
jgi:chromobox protein 1